MKKITARLLLFLLVASGLYGCLRAPDYPKEPRIAFLGMSKNTVAQSLLNKDSILIRFSFTDGDGDIGNTADDNTLNIFLRDSRDSFIANQYRIPFVPSEGAANGISGEITVVAYTTCCYYPDELEIPCTPSLTYPVDTLRYLIHIVDRAGNLSNVIETPDIYILCSE